MATVQMLRPSQIAAKTEFATGPVLLVSRSGTSRVWLPHKRRRNRRGWRSRERGTRHGVTIVGPLLASPLIDLALYFLICGDSHLFDCGLERAHT